MVIKKKNIHRQSVDLPVGLYLVRLKVFLNKNEQALFVLNFNTEHQESYPNHWSVRLRKSHCTGMSLCTFSKLAFVILIRWNENIYVGSRRISESRVPVLWVHQGWQAGRSWVHLPPPPRAASSSQAGRLLGLSSSYSPGQSWMHRGSARANAAAWYTLQSQQLFLRLLFWCLRFLRPESWYDLGKTLEIPFLWWRPRPTPATHLMPDTRGVTNLFATFCHAL